VSSRTKGTELRERQNRRRCEEQEHIKHVSVVGFLSLFSKALLHKEAVFFIVGSETSVCFLKLAPQ
jgi:hypothetical protein